MEFSFTPSQEALRTEVRSFFATLQKPNGDDEVPNTSLEQAMAANGWLTMAWPAEYGGRGASQMEQLIFKEELFEFGGSFDFLGVQLAGPTIMVHGNAEQKATHLPAIAGAKVRWCQGFSEPGAGSDLASLQTRAVRDGDDFVINGQKIWTSNAHHADWILLLTRTDPEAPKHRGISMFLVDMKTPGITIRPLIQLTGVHGFNEVYFDDVRVPAKNMVGELNRGWYAATTTLDFERSGIERNLVARRDWNRTYGLLRSGTVSGLASRPTVWRHQVADLFIAVEAGQWMARRVAYLQSKGLVPNYEASMSKTFNSELGQRVADFSVNVLGLPGQLRDGAHAPANGVPAFRFLDARRLTIGQGTSEINRNIIATRGLGLPR
ncbi:MAG TPA: acyl-CoA dehydrogenase family protein [Tepidiformaceae bacterium]|nr:acyl-CoA dehydrogenase family protein [Tepidiformaceae bacterium]